MSTVKLVSFTQNDMDVVLLAKDLKMSLLLDFYAGVLTEKQRQMLQLYYNEDLSLGEIAEGSGITRQGVRDTLKRGEATMTELENSLGFAEWYAQLRRLCGSIRECVQDIELHNQNSGYQEYYQKKTAEIYGLLNELEND